MTIDNEKFMARIEKVERKIRFYARFFSYKTNLLEEDDLFQIAMLALLERYHVDTDFINQNNSYIACYASWMMKNAILHEKNMYIKHIVDLAETDKGDIQLSGHYPYPEAETIKSEIHSIAHQMPRQYQTIFNATVRGYESWEIADMIGTTTGTFKWRKRTMIDKLNKAWRVSLIERKNVIREMYDLPSIKEDIVNV